MHVTAHTDYALRTLIYLATHAGRRATTKEIAEAYGISSNHLLKVVNALGALSHVDVIRGKGGGLELKREPVDICIGDVVRNFETDFHLLECFDAERNTCVISPACNLKGIFTDAMNAFLDVLDKKTLADVLSSRRRALERLLPVV